MNRDPAVLFDEFEAMPFPPEAKGIELQGVDLVLLDSLMAGCISSLLSSNIDAMERAEKTKLLMAFKSQLDAVLADAPSDAQPYFKKLGTVTALLLSRTRSPHADV